MHIQMAEKHIAKISAQDFWTLNLVNIGVSYTYGIVAFKECVWFHY